MAEFGPQATELSAPQGAGANPTQGVQTSLYTPDLSPIASLFQKGMAMYEDYQNKKAKEGQDAVLSGFANEMGAAEQEYLQDQNSNKYMVKRGLIINKYRTMAPGLTTEFSKMMGLSKEGIGGMAEDEETATRKRRQSILSAAVDAGIPQPRGKEAEDAVIDAMQTSRRIQAQTKEMFESRQREAQMSTWEREQSAEERKKQAGSNLVQLAGKHSTAFLTQLKAITKAVSSGQMTPEDAMAEATDYYNTINMQLNAAAVFDKDLVEPFKRNFETIFNNMSPFFKKGADLEAQENIVKKMEAATKIRVFGNNPDLHAMSVVSQAFGNQPEVFRYADPIVSSSLMKMGLKERGQEVTSKGPDVQIIGNEKYEKQSFDVIKGGITNLLDGNLDAKAKKDVRTEVFGQMKGVMEQYVDQFQLNKLSTASRKQMNEFLLDKNVARFLKENPLPTNVARGLAAASEVAFKQFERTFNEAAGGMLKGVDNRSTVQKMGGRGMGGQNQKPVRSESVNAIDAVDIYWQGDRIVFEPKNVPADPLDRNMLMSQLEKVSTILSNGVKVNAHIHGDDNYESYFDKIKWKLFPSKFPREESAPVSSKTITGATSVPGEKGEDAKIRMEVNKDPIYEEPYSETNVKNIRAELARDGLNTLQREALLDALEKEYAKRGR